MLDLKKPVQTRDGRQATIILTNSLKHPIYHVAAVVINEEGHEVVETYTADGEQIAGKISGWDLVNIKTQE